jgi:hypothetical protein
MSTYASTLPTVTYSDPEPELPNWRKEARLDEAAIRLVLRKREAIGELEELASVSPEAAAARFTQLAEQLADDE